MSSNQSDILISLNDTDRLLQSKLKEQAGLDSKKGILEASIATKKSELEKAVVSLDRAKVVRTTEQEKLDQEQTKISERRKQISAIGGAKSAKLVERELEIAKRFIENLEKNVFAAIQNEETLEKKKDSLTEAILATQSDVENFEEEFKRLSPELISEINSLKATREKSISILDERVSALYKRVESRYKGDAIAYAEDGSCRSCYRALPAQTYNQIIAGYNLIQCPGCSRILVYIAPPPSEVKEEPPKKAKKQANAK